MNALTHLAGTPLTMTSREIAELVGSRHDDTKRSIERLANQGVITLPPMAEVSNTGPGPKMVTVFVFSGEKGKRDSIIVVAQLSPEFTAALVDRWQELERQRSMSAVPQSFAQALRLAAEQQEQLELQQAALAAARPKVVYADAMLNADGTVLVRDAAKTIGVPVRKLERALREKGVILPDNAPAARYVAQGYFKESLHSYDTNTHGRQLSRVARVTGRGLEFLRRFVDRHAALFAHAQRKAAS